MQSLVRIVSLFYSYFNWLSSGIKYIFGVSEYMLAFHEESYDLEDKAKRQAFKRQMNKSVSDMFREIRHKVEKQNI